MLINHTCHPSQTKKSTAFGSLFSHFQSPIIYILLMNSINSKFCDKLKPSKAVSSNNYFSRNQQVFYIHGEENLLKKKKKE